MEDVRRSRKPAGLIGRRAFAAGAAWTLMSGTGWGRPHGYPRSYDRLEELAEQEGQLLIYSSADSEEFAEVLRVFRAAHPRIRVTYQHVESSVLYSQYLREANAGRPSADLLISSAMDTQIKLVNDGYAQSYASPEKPNLPAWAVWKNQAFGITAEPIVFVYNRKLMPPADVPRSHDDLERLLRTKPQDYMGRVATYDVARSSTGYLFFSQDVQISHDTWKLLKSLGRTRPELYVQGHEILRQVTQGRQILAYNMMSSYALAWRAAYPEIGVVFPNDYTLVMSRTAFISKEARHPAAAKIFLDFLLSSTGQKLLAQRYMTPVRTDLGAGSPRQNADTLKAIHVGPALLAGLDQIKHARLVTEWRRAVQP